MILKSITVIDEQDDFIIVNKPADIGFHDDEHSQGFFNQVKVALSQSELYPVHRLDKMTSGLLIIAKNKATATQFQQLFEHKKIEKYYLAISDKKPSKKQGVIKGDMVKSRRGMWKLMRSQINPAISQFFSYSLTEGKRLFLVKPHSGKTHQIRVALNSIGSPIIGDPSYYSTSIADRGYLHAFALCFTLHQQNYYYVAQPSEGRQYLQETALGITKELLTPWELTWPKLK